MDIGACDPVRSSVTKLFYDRGWNGINVDASPRWHRELNATRPRDRNIHALVGLGPTRPFYIVGHGSAYDSVHPEFLTQYNNVTSTDMAPVPLSDILKGTPDIDFLKIDAEGSELDVLKSNDWSRFRPRFLCIESTKPFTEIETHGEWEPIVLDAGYRFIRRVGHDRIYERTR